MSTRVRPAQACSPVLASSFAQYSLAAVRAGLSGAEYWRVETQRDGSVWLCVDPPEHRSRQRQRRPLATRSRLAGDVETAARLLREQTARLDRFISDTVQ